ncbi:MAG: alpha/beta hydrolase [Lewinella sp.]|nr:alpha/beta hydrolase [Lewinella sp.]
MLKGTALHELMHIPGYWRDINRVDHPDYRRENLRYGPHPRQYVEVLLPPDREPQAWLIYWHGGGWRFGHPEQFLPAAFPWLELGMAVALPSYRRIPRYRWDSIEADLIASLRAIQRDMGLHAGVEAPFILSGLSAGGHLAATVGLRPDILAKSGWREDQLKGIISCAGVLSMAHMPMPVRWALAGNDESQQPLFDPYQLVHPAAPPCYLLHGPKDGLAPYAGAAAFQSHYEAVAPGQCTMHVIPDGTHLDAGRWSTVDQQTRRRLQQVVANWLSVN